MGLRGKKYVEKYDGMRVLALKLEQVLIRVVEREKGRAEEIRYVM